MTLPGGYMGKILRVELTKGKITTEPLKEELVKPYLGAPGIGARILYDEVPAYVGALDPLNKLIFATGPVTGTMIPTAGRHTVISKSPLTGYFGDAGSGGFWGAELKFSGHDVIVVTGKSPKPVYLWVHNDNYELRDADPYWGMDARASDKAIRNDLGDKRIVVANIGEAGENMVRFASVVNDEACRVAGRNGLGAVMGFMNLKAIAVRGDQKVPVANPDGVRELSRELMLHQKNDDGVKEFRAGGTPSVWTTCWETGDTPSHNWANETFGDYDSSALDFPGPYETILQGNKSCYLCPISCRRVNVGIDDPGYEVEAGVEGPEYETEGALGSTCGVANLKAISKANDLCNIHGMDTISAGGVVGFAMECYERGLIDKDYTDGLDLKFGNDLALIDLMTKIARRQGFGNILAEGARRASQIIGKGAEQYAITVKGQEMPMHDPRAFQGGGPHYACAPTGADHCEGFTFGLEIGGVTYPELGFNKPLNRFITEGKGKASVIMQNYMTFIHCTGVCMFSDEAGGYGSVPVYLKLLNVITGDDYSIEDALTLGERVWNLKKAFNMKHGCTRAEDTLPDRLLKQPDKRAQNSVVKLDETLPEYYQVRGWDWETGKPTKERLTSLGLNTEAQDLWT